MIFLSAGQLLRIAERVVGADVGIRDIGLLESAAARPRATVFGADAYPTLHEKAAALVHSVVTNHALVDGNKRLGLASAIAFLGINGWRLTLTEDEAYDLIVEIASGELTEVESIADRLARGSEPTGRQ
jgi:death-on-curing protein